MTIPSQVEPDQWIHPASPSAAVDDDAWSFFGPIYCISLKHRHDRRASATEEFRRIGLDGRVTFFLADKHPVNSEQGIYESHQACLRAGLETGDGPIVVFEDDIRFRHFNLKTLREATDFLRDDETWRAFFFGCYVISSASTKRRAVRSIRYRCTAHAYVLKRELAEKIVSLPWSGVAYDDLLRSFDTGQYYVIYPGFAFQSSSPTDNDQNLRRDRVRRLFGGMHFGQRWDEFSHRNWRSMIVMHFISLLVLVGIYFLMLKLWR